MNKNNHPLSETIRHQVAFYDVDAYRIAWHGSYVKYFELARCALLEKLQFTYEDMEHSGYFFPIVDLHIKYIKPLRFRQHISITATITEWKNRLVIGYLIQDAQSDARLTKGRTIQAAVAMPDEVMQFETPTILHEKIQQCLTS